MKLWKPDARKVQLPDAGAFAGGGHKIVLHTTEGPTIDGAISALRAANAAPHFVIDSRANLVQMVPLNRAGRSLQHPSGPETNRANAIQIEMVGYTAHTADWGEEYLADIRKLCRWIERQFNVPRKVGDGVHFKPGADRLGGQAFYDYKGYCGHMHVPGNDHVDPGNFPINHVLHDKR